jgi:hypothetical protein
MERRSSAVTCSTTDRVSIGRTEIDSVGGQHDLVVRAVIVAGNFVHSC